MSSYNKGTNFETLCVLVGTVNMGSEFSRAYLSCVRVNSSLINDSNMGVLLVPMVHVQKREELFAFVYGDGYQRRGFDL